MQIDHESTNFVSHASLLRNKKKTETNVCHFVIANSSKILSAQKRLLSEFYLAKKSVFDRGDEF